MHLLSSPRKKLRETSPRHRTAKPWKQFFLAVLFSSSLLLGAQAQDEQNTKSDLDLVQQLLVARKDYQRSLVLLRSHYLQVGDLEKAKWAEDELIAYHRIPKRAFRLELDVPPETLRGVKNIPEANKLYSRAMTYKGKGWAQDFNDNQRRAEILLQQLLTLYPDSNRISDAAYQLGDIYEKAPYKHYKRAALYFERCFQWEPATEFDARLRAARLYDRVVQNRKKAMEIYKEILTHETNPTLHREANTRLKELSGRPPY